MTEVLFYHLQGRNLESVLPSLLERSLQRGWRVVVQAGSDERVEALDAYLWTYNDGSFLPHASWREPDPAEQPIVLTVNADNPNRANVRFLVDGADLPLDAGDYDRLVLIFDGDDEDATAAARVRWSQARDAGFEVTYWQPDERGRWSRKA